jgi:hypothetical protein
MSFLLRFILLAVLACGCENVRGQLMLVIDTDLTPGGDRRDFDAFQIGITNDGFASRRFDEFGSPDLPVAFPATFAIVGNGDPSEKIHVRLYAGRLGEGETVVGGPKLLREVVTTIPDERIVAVRLTLEWACYGGAYDKGVPDHYIEAHCPEEPIGTTCVAGGCTEWNVDSSTLPDFDEAEIFGSTCFDAIACLRNGAPQVLDPSSCSIPKPEAVTNVGIVTADQLGVCEEGGACYVALDAESPRGWTSSGDRIQLPPGYCTPAEGIGTGRILRIVTSADCPPKTERNPTCGPWSSVGP